MATFNPAHIVAAPGTLYETLLGEDDMLTKAFVCLEQNNAAPGSQGVVSIIYSIWQYHQALGQPPNPSSDRVFGFTGNVLNKNAPTSVELSPVIFHLVVNDTDMQIYTPETMNLILASGSTIEAVDMGVRCHCLYPVPFLYMAPFLTWSLTPRVAFIALYQQTAIHLGQVDAIRSLLWWLLACLMHNETLSMGTNHSHLGTAILQPPWMDATLQEHCRHVVVR
jgi:hypothetical protein